MDAEPKEEQQAILITGEAVNSVDIEKLKAVLILIDMRGVDVAIIPVPENATLKAEHGPSAHNYATYEELETFALSRPEYSGSPRIHTRLWNILARLTLASVGRYPEVNSADRGKIVIGSGEEIQIFRIDDHPEPYAEIGNFYGRSAQGYSLSLDGLEQLVHSKDFRRIPNAGIKNQQFAEDFIEERKNIIESPSNQSE